MFTKTRCDCGHPVHACSYCVMIYKCGNYRATVNSDIMTVLIFFFFNVSRATKNKTGTIIQVQTGSVKNLAVLRLQ